MLTKQHLAMMVLRSSGDHTEGPFGPPDAPCQVAVPDRVVGPTVGAGPLGLARVTLRIGGDREASTQPIPGTVNSSGT